jgi:hypothetical protein
MDWGLTLDIDTNRNAEGQEGGESPSPSLDYSLILLAKEVRML